MRSLLPRQIDAGVTCKRLADSHIDVRLLRGFLEPLELDPAFLAIMRGNPTRFGIPGWSLQ